MIRIIIWIIVGLLALSFFGISLQALVESPTNQENVSFLWALLEQGWEIIQQWFVSVVDFFLALIGQ